MNEIYYVMYLLDIKETYEIHRDITKNIIHQKFRGEADKTNPVKNTLKC